MGIAFGVALILIYILVVWEFGNFTMPAIVMFPIPLTLIGIVPGHWLFGAPFTATSMIGFIALAGIIVRNSILLVDFSRHAVEGGMDVTDAVIHACATRTRPIIITALALMVGSSVILSDPIFQGMAVSLMMGGLVSTVLTLVVIPLGCVSFRQALSEKVAAEKAADKTMHKVVPENNKLPRRSRNGSASVLAAIGDIFLLIGEMIGFVFVSIFKGGAKIFGADSKPTIPAKPVEPAKPTTPTTPPPVVKVEEPKPAEVKTAVKKPPAKPAAKPEAKTPAAKPETAKADPVKAEAKPAAPAKKPAAKKTPAKKTPARKAPAKKTATKKTPAKKAPARKTTRKTATKPAARSKAKTSGRRGIRLKKPTDSTEE
jgi:hypothetical protein